MAAGLQEAALGLGGGGRPGAGGAACTAEGACLSSVSCDVLGSGRVHDLHCSAVTVVVSQTASSWAGLEGTEREVARCAGLALSLSVVPAGPSSGGRGK